MDRTRLLPLPQGKDASVSNRKRVLHVFDLAPLAALRGIQNGIAHVLGFQRIAERFEPMLGALAGPIRWCAGATFTVYLFHLPICQFLTTVVPWPPGAWQTRLVMLCGAMAIMLAIAEVTERRKTEWRGFVLRIIRGAGHKTTA